MAASVVCFLVAWAVGEVRAQPVFPSALYRFIVKVRAFVSFGAPEAAVAKAVLVAAQYKGSSYRGVSLLMVVAFL